MRRLFPAEQSASIFALRAIDIRLRRLIYDRLTRDVWRGHSICSLREQGIVSRGFAPYPTNAFEKALDRYLLPDLKAPETPRIGKYGLLRHQYLRAHKRAILTGLQTSGKLNAHLEQVDREATEIEQRLIAQFVATECVTESLKRHDQMAWVGAMNNIRKRVEEIIINGIINV